MKKWKKTVLTSIVGVTLAWQATAAHAAATYTATDNDTFWFMSKRFNVPLQQLMAANPKIDPLNIYKGLKITIPDPIPALKANSSIQSAPAAESKANLAAAAANNNTVKTASGQEGSYKRVINGTATAYSAAASENGKWGPVDYYGNPLKLGTIAVDPKMIPLGSKVYVTGYSFDGLPKGGMIATATDIGGAIKGNRIDIFVPGPQSKVRKFGIQNVKIYVLD